MGKSGGKKRTEQKRGEDRRRQGREGERKQGLSNSQIITIRYSVPLEQPKVIVIVNFFSPGSLSGFHRKK